MMKDNNGSIITKPSESKKSAQKCEKKQWNQSSQKNK